ncbi:MAG: leishmanolysin-related zinc metalloendopeptidase [Gemmatimonadota bacterium]
MQRFLAFVPRPVGLRAVSGTVLLAFVLAGCGSNQSCAVTDSCPNQAPEVTITSPADGGTSTLGEAVTFSGEATDSEDGAITGSALVWTSDLDGPIGTGAEFSRSDLSGGFHEITLTATDSEGASGSATITFGIGGAPQVEIDGPEEQSNGAPHTVTVGTTVTFSGSAVDVEDGSLAGAALSWTSNVDGPLGTGSSLPTDVLSAGMHTVTLTATDSDDNEAKATVLVIVKPPAADGFQIHVRNSEGVELTPAQRQAVEAAVAKLEAVIVGDVPNIAAFEFDGGTCGGATVPPMSESIDDVVIYLEFVPIDGSGGTIGSAGPCQVRTASGEEVTAFSVLGGMRFDTADLEMMDDVGLLEDIVLHEMMHVLGFGIFWEGVVVPPAVDPDTFLRQPSNPGNDNYTEGMTDTHFTGANAIARFDAVGGDAYLGGEVVPVENDTASFSTGSLDGHWRESVFGEEIMSTAANLPENPLSVVTIGQFEDLGYDVDYDAADAYTLPVPVIVDGLRVTGATIDLSGDVWRGPLYGVDADGTQRRIR